MELIEREQQLNILAEAWRAVRSGKGRIALISGEAGIGKTSLVECFVSEQRKSARILRGACDALFSPRPLGPFIDIAVQTESDLLRLARTGVDRLSFSTEFFVYLQKSIVPTVVVIEDLHWADEATLDVVKFLGRRIQHTRTLLILTYRDDEVSSKHPLRYLLGDFPTHLTDRIALPLLSRQAVERLAQQSKKQADELYHVTGGNPFFVTEIISCDGDGVPASVRDAALARVARLSAPAREVVELASLVPGAAEVWLIQAVLDPASTALDECLELGILHSEENTLAFRHELARQAVEDSLPIGRLRDLHAEILETLLEQGADRIPLSRLVHHAVRAGNEEATLRYAPEAARRASALSAHREAISLYNSCLVYRHRLPLETQAELLEGLSFENYLVNNLDEAIQTRQQATGIWEQLERYVRAGNCNRWLSRLYWVLGIQSEAKQYADRAVDILMNQPPGPELAMAFSTKSQIHMLALEEEPALEWGQRAIDLAGELGAAEILVHALTNVGSMIVNTDYEQGKEKIERALSIAHEHRMHEHVARCYTNLLGSCIQFRKYTDAQDFLKEGLEYTTARDLDVYTVYMRGWQARMSFETGRWDEAEQQALEALRLSRGETVIALPALIALAHLKVRQGDPGAAEFLERAHALALPTGELQRIGPVAAARAEAAWWQGDEDQVTAEASPAYELALSRNDAWTRGQLAYWMWLGGAQDITQEGLARPYALMIQGDWQAAAEAWELFGCPFEQAMALSEVDEPAKVQALSIFEQLGARPAASRLRQTLLTQGVTDIPPMAEPSNPPDREDLTPREIEVLELIAAGLSNPAIARQLTISVGTVKAHTSNIYNKLGANNRVQAVVRAQELSLVDK